MKKKTLRLIIYPPISHCVFYLSGYAHFIQGRQYWKFDPVGMNSLEGYPRYIGVDFFGCRNVWVSNLWRIRLTFFFFFFFNNEEEFFLEQTFVCSRGMRRSPFKSGYALLHLLILRSVTPSSQEKPRYVSSDLAPPVQLYSYLFCTFVTTRLRSGPCIIDVWCWCEPYRSHLLSLSLKFSFFFYRFWFTDRTSTDCLPCSGCFPFQLFFLFFFFIMDGLADPQAFEEWYQTYGGGRFIRVNFKPWSEISQHDRLVNTIFSHTLLFKDVLHTANLTHTDQKWSYVVFKLLFYYTEFWKRCLICIKNVCCTFDQALWTCVCVCALYQLNVSSSAVTSLGISHSEMNLSLTPVLCIVTTSRANFNGISWISEGKCKFKQDPICWCYVYIGNWLRRDKQMHQFCSQVPLKDHFHLI